MSPYLNFRARLERANRNNHTGYSAWQTFRRFKWFTLGMIVLMPIYPSLSVLGSDYGAAADYDESSIITAYNDDEGVPAYIAENGFVSTDYDVSTPLVERQMPETMDGSTQPIIKKSPNSERYIVKAGDTIEKIAAHYGVSPDTVYWANDLESSDILSIGTSLRVPPVSGVVYTVVSGDTLSEIAQKYDVDAHEIVRVNNLTDAASIRKGMDLMIPGAAPKKVEKSTQIAKAPIESPKSKITTLQKQTKIARDDDSDSDDGIKSRYEVKYNGHSGGFAWGNCTWYVAQHKSVTWHGNANQWIRNAKAAGVKT